MYRCDLCGSVVPPRTRGFRVLVERRAKRYPFRELANPNEPAPPKPKKKDDPPPHDPRNDPGGVGWEIACEVTACPAYAAAKGVDVSESLLSSPSAPVDPKGGQ